MAEWGIIIGLHNLQSNFASNILLDDYVRKNTGALASITEIGKLRFKDVKWSDQNNIINATAGTETQFSPDPNAHSMLCIILSPRLSQIKIPGDKKERN